MLSTCVRIVTRSTGVEHDEYSIMSMAPAFRILVQKRSTRPSAIKIPSENRTTTATEMCIKPCSCHILAAEASYTFGKQKLGSRFIG